MNETTYGYMRVSTREQNEDRQRIALLESGVPEENLYLDKQSGKDFKGLSQNTRRLLKNYDSRFTRSG